MFDFFFNPQGRISRKGWWLGYLLPYLAITIVLSLLEAVSPIFAVLGFLAGLFYLWPGLVAVPVKRFHDQGMTGFWQLGYVVLNLVVTIAFFIGVAISAQQGGYADRLESLGTLAPEEQMAALGEIIGMGLGNPVALISAIVLVLINLAYLYFMGIRKGQAGANQHGEDPHASGRGFAD